MNFLENQFNLFCGDAVAFLKEMSSNSVDCVVTDPPYKTISGGAQENAAVNKPTGILQKNDGKIFRRKV